MNYLDAFQRPFQDLKKLTIGAVLNGIPVLNILTGLLVTGYTAEALRITLAKKNSLPPWQHFLDLFKKGVFLTLLWAIYSIPLFLALLTLLFKSAETLLEKTQPAALLADLLQQHWAYLVLLCLLFLATWYIALLATVHYIATYRFKDGLQLQVILSRAFTLTYLKAWIVSFGYTALVGIFLQALLTTIQSEGIEGIFLGIVYNLFAGYLTFATALTTMTLCGQAYRELARLR
ncbi:MAG: DUF4013 domain-containing protein [Nanoarchaeota archaeon]